MGVGVTILIYALIFFGFYYILIRPQMKKNKEVAAMVRNLKEGDMIVTIGGICGTIIELTEDEVLVDSEGTNIRFKRVAIRSVHLPELTETQAVEEIEEMQEME